MEYKDYELIIRDLIEKKNNTTDEKEIENLSNKIKKLCHEANQNLTSWDRVCIARNKSHPKAEDYIKRLFVLCFFWIFVLQVKSIIWFVDYQYHILWSSLRKVSQIKYDLISTISGAKSLSNIQLYTEVMPPSL